MPGTPVVLALLQHVATAAAMNLKRAVDWFNGTLRAKGILESIDMESYRAEAQATMDIALADQDAEIDPVPVSGGAMKPEPELDVLSNIVHAFNDQFGNIEWKDADKIRKVIAEELPERVSADEKYRNAMANSDKQNARIEHDRALRDVLVALLSDHTELFKQYSDNASFKKWLADTIFAATYTPPGT